MNMLFPRNNREEFPDKIKLIKKLDCLTQGWHGQQCAGDIDPAHYRHGLYLGSNIKDDLYINPLCRIHHSLQHSMGEKRFWGERLMDAKVQALLIHIAYLNDSFEQMQWRVRNF